MPIYDTARVQNLQDAEARKRVSPFLTDGFDVITLDRPGFLQEVGLEPGDESLLRTGALGHAQLRHPLFWRALGEEIRSQKQQALDFFERYSTVPPESQWLTAVRIVLRMHQLLDPSACSPKDVASQLELRPEDLEARRKAIPATPEQEAELILAVMLQLLGVGSARAALGEAVEHQLHRRALLFFSSDVPSLTHLDKGPLEVEIVVATPQGKRTVRRSLAELMHQVADLEQELWAESWLKYFSGHSELSADELQAVVDHLQEKDRYRWTLVVAAGSTKSRRAVASVAVAATEALASNRDTAGLQRLLQLFDNFSERYDIEGALKRKFGAPK